MPSFAASWESLLVFLVIVLLSGLSNWLKQRQSRRQEAELDGARGTGQGEPAGPPPLLPPRSPEASDWEKELRRLLGEEPEPMPPRPVLPPPLSQPVLTSPPPPREQVAGQTADWTSLETGGKPFLVSAETELESAAEHAGSSEEEEYGEAPLAPLAELSAAWRHAGHVPGGSTPVQQAVVSPARGGVRLISPEIARVRAQLHRPRTAREAILAAVIMGPPRGLEARE